MFDMVKLYVEKEVDKLIQMKVKETQRAKIKIMKKPKNHNIPNDGYFEVDASD
jgi:hypothetical protein